MPDRSLVIIALLLNSALYLVGVLVTGLLWHKDAAVIASLLTIGICYLGPMFQLAADTTANTALRRVAAVLTVASILTGAAAGLALFL